MKLLRQQSLFSSAGAGTVASLRSMVQQGFGAGSFKEPVSAFSKKGRGVVALLAQPPAAI